MPKIIPELRQALLATARRRLVDSPEHDLTMRQVAADCGVAVGTAYNYFPSKEHLLAGIILEDWQTVQEELMAIARSSPEPLAGLWAMEQALCSFVERYSLTWRHYAGRTQGVGPVEARRAQLIRQVADAVTVLLEQGGLAVYPEEAPALAEMLLILAQRQPEAFDRLVPVIRKIIS